MLSSISDAHPCMAHHTSEKRGKKCRASKSIWELTVKMKKIKEESRNRHAEDWNQVGGEEESDTSGKQVGPFIPFRYFFGPSIVPSVIFTMFLHDRQKELYK